MTTKENQIYLSVEFEDFFKSVYCRASIVRFWESIFGNLPMNTRKKLYIFKFIVKVSLIILPYNVILLFLDYRHDQNFCHGLLCTHEMSGMELQGV